jgi:hypothetical protein
MAWWCAPVMIFPGKSWFSGGFQGIFLGGGVALCASRARTKSASGFGATGI